MSETPSPPSETPVPSGPVSLGLPPRLIRPAIEGRVRAACILSLVALGLITWSLVDPRPLPVIAAMTIGQIIGTASLIFFLASIAIDVRARFRIARRGHQHHPPSKP